MSVREVAGLNLVINQELTGTVDVAFRDAPVHEVLDTLLLSRGLGYRPVGDGLVVVPLADLGAGNPLLATEVIPTPSVEPGAVAADRGGDAVARGPGARDDRRPGAGGVRLPGAAGVDPRAGGASWTPPPPRTPPRPPPRPPPRRAGRTAAPRPPTPPAAAAARGDARRARAGSAGRRNRWNPTVLELQFVPATEMAVALAPLLGPLGKVSAMENEGRLLIVDAPSNLLAIRGAVRELDVPRVQVRIRALIYDCAIEDGRDLGLNWGGQLRGRGFAADGSPLQTLTFNGVTAAGAVNPTAAGGLAAAQTASRFLDLTSTLRALNESKDSRLLADPNVVVLNHERADIKIVTEVPYQELTQSALGGAIGTTSFREAGVRLEVTPHIAPDGTVVMLVHPEFSVLSGFTPDTNAPIIDTREATTTVRIADRETLVLGGLRQRSKVRSRNSLPFFGDLPLCGRLFRKQNFEVRESELLVFLTPEIVGTGYSGDCRETGLAVFGKSELGASPLCPVPMGTAAALHEDRCALGERCFGRAERRGRWAAGGAVACELPPGVLAAPTTNGLIAPSFGPADAYGPADAPPPAPRTFDRSSAPPRRGPITTVPRVAPRAPPAFPEMPGAGTAPPPLAAPF